MNQPHDKRDRDAEELAVVFHDTYERLAPKFGYKTALATRRFDAQSPNGRLMIAVCRQLLDRVEPFATSANRQITDEDITNLVVTLDLDAVHPIGALDIDKAVAAIRDWLKKTAAQVTEEKANPFGRSGPASAVSSIEPSSPLLPGLLEAERIMRAVGYDEEDLVMMRLLAHIETQRTFPSAIEPRKNASTLAKIDVLKAIERDIHDMSNVQKVTLEGRAVVKGMALVEQHIRKMIDQLERTAKP